MWMKLWDVSDIGESDDDFTTIKIVYDYIITVWDGEPILDFKSV